jgi:HlyD family secretion protein
MLQNAPAPFAPVQAVAQYAPAPPMANAPPMPHAAPTRPPGSPSKAPGGPGPGPGAAPKRPSFLAKIARPLLILALGASAYGAYLYRARHMPYEWTGTVEAKTVQVGSRTGGRVKEIHVREGDEVKAGQLLVTLEPHDLLAQRSAAEAELAVTEATLAKLQHGARREEIEEARAKLAAQAAAVSQAQLRAAHESAELRRTQAMVEGRALAKAELDAHKAATGAAEGETAQAIARAGEARAALALLTGGTRDEDLKAGEAAVASARAKLLGLGIAITELEVRAARDARVESMNVRPGNLLAANAPAVTLLETGEIYVRVYVPETLVGKLKIGQAVPISVDSFPDRTFRGKVEHVSAVGEYTPRNLTTIDDRANEVFAARVGLLEGQTELRAGMVANIHVAK